jgi:two-component system cell cycle response regulator
MDDSRRKAKKVNALIVDPSEEIRQTLMEKFQEAGFFSHTAQSGKEALELVKEFFFNFAVTEVELPDMKGLDLLKGIKRIHPDTAVVFITGSPSLETSVDALNAGAGAFLVKPIQPEPLMQHVNGLLERQKNIIETRELLFAERKKREFYQYLSIRDGLTDLYNHRHFHELLNQEMAPAVRNNQPLSLLMVDIDNFKQFNDTYGHPTGDQALQVIGKIFIDNSRRVDHVCRYGGEEFALITPETNGASAVYLAKRLLTKVRKTRIQVYDSSIEVRLTISIGIASYPVDADNKTDLILRADENLLLAKRAGKDCYYPPST